MDEESLEFLLRGGHLSMPDRIARGLWPHPPLSRRLMVNLIVRLVRRDGSFPRPWQPAVPGKPVLEGGVIEHRGPFNFVYRAQRAPAIDPCSVAEVMERRFLSASAAARFYLRWAFGPSGDLDGWKVT